MKNLLAVIWSALGYVLGLWLGPLDGLLLALCVFMATDYVTGVVAAIKEHKLSSSVGFIGLLRKLLMLALVGIGHMLDVYVLGDNAGIRTLVIFFYLGNEGISILENAGAAGLPVPAKVKDILAQLREGSDNE